MIRKPFYKSVMEQLVKKYSSLDVNLGNNDKLEMFMQIFTTYLIPS